MPTALSISSSVSLSGSPFCLPLASASVAPGVLSHRAQSPARKWIILDLEVLAALQQANKYLLQFAPLPPPPIQPHLDNETAHKVAHVSLLYRHSLSQYGGKKSQSGRTCVHSIYKVSQVCSNGAERVRRGSSGFCQQWADQTWEEDAAGWGCVGQRRPISLVFKLGTRLLVEKHTRAANMFTCACDFYVTFTRHCAERVEIEGTGWLLHRQGVLFGTWRPYIESHYFNVTAEKFWIITCHFVYYNKMW